MQIITYTEENHVKRHRGTMPIILTCPHGGSQVPLGVSLRTQQNTPSTCTGGNAFNGSGDVFTDKVTEGIAEKILNLTGLSPYVVIALFRRDRIDANRPEACAYIDPDAAAIYRGYHQRIADYADQIALENIGKGFLFDIHGITGETPPADIYLGTGNGSTLRPGLSRNDLYMRHGLHGLLSAVRRFEMLPDNLPLPTEVRYTVDPPNAQTNEALNGGYTVRQHSETLNCIQIEIDRKLRDDAIRQKLIIEDLAHSIINFSRRHAPF
ncbi:MAG: hypothetical protein RL456_1602 [Pseudomonadota bacterium]|jgi:hypothetical protein